MFRERLYFMLLVFALLAAYSPSESNDDLANSKVMEVLDRIASSGKRPTSVRRLFKTNDKNQIVELVLANKKLEAGDLKTLSALEQLQVLDLSSTNINDDSLRQISRFSSLRKLNLYATKITSAGVSHLRMIVQLESINLRRTGIDDAALGTLKTLPNLKQIGLRSCPISVKGLKSLGNLKKLEALDLGDTKLDDNCAQVLVKFPSLRSVTLDETDVSNDGLRQLAKNPRLAWMASPDQTVKEWVSRIKQKNFDGLDEMSPVGLRMPRDGKLSREVVAKKEQQLKDKVRNRHHFRTEFFWEVEGRKPTKLFAELRVERGHVGIMNMGISE